METKNGKALRWNNKHYPGLGERLGAQYLRMLLLLLWLILMGCFSHSLMGQQSCTLVCKSPTKEAPIELAIGANCEALITPQLVLQNADLCPGDKMLTIRNLAGDLLFEGQNQILEDFSSLVGDTISVTIRHLTTGAFCPSFFVVVDNNPPKLVCQDTVIACNADTSVASLGLPEITDNCGGSLRLTFEDSLDIPDCNSLGTILITRKWSAFDRNKNVANCTQSIVLERPNLAEVVFPPNVNLSCDAPFADPDSTGYPMLHGDRLTTSSPCNILVTYTDDTTMTCNGLGMTIVRRWLVIKRCDGTSRSFDQIINIKDTTPPVITCPDNISVETNIGMCSAVITLPAPVSISDNCDANATYLVSTSYGNSGLGPHINVPVGTHFVTYTAIDACNNRSSCTINLNVTDNEKPVAVCDDKVTVSLSDGGIGIVAARFFDEGSWDNCADTIHYKARRMDVGECSLLNGDDSQLQDGYQEWFDDYVFFCCEDSNNDSLRVILRVYEKNPGTGPVDPERETGGGDLAGHYNQCMFIVKIEDKLPPRIVCPAPDTVDCRTDLTDLSIFGEAQVIEGCWYTLDTSAIYNLDNCGVGTIERTFTATDSSGNSTSCNQIIYLENQHPLVDTMITWPKDYETYECGESVRPEDLPAKYSEPVVDFNSCSLIGISYEDIQFDISYPACYKILRRWSVIDWCTYTDDANTKEIRYDHTQIIAVYDKEPPTITCPDEITVGTNISCTRAVVNIPPATALDCSPSVVITNNSPFAYSNGADASGEYPLGETLVTFTASDGCGNVSRCSMIIRVVDNKAPSPVCIKGLSINLQQMETGQVMAIATAQMFNGSTVDNCSPSNTIKLTARVANGDSLRRVPESDTLIFTCSDVGEQIVELWATDVFGNSDYCVTTIDVQDNNRVCPLGTTSGRLAGDIRTDNNKRVENVVVEIQSSNSLAAKTGVDGLYEVNDLPYGGNYMIMPQKTDDVLNGVTTLDVILISKHILGVQPITGPYQLIAADIDRSGGISTLDVIRLRKLVLKQDDDFPNGISWRFIDADFKFKPGEDPLKQPFPEYKTIQNFNSGSSSVNFIAVKLGDINGSVQPNSLLKSQGRTTEGEMVIQIQDRDFTAGEEFTVDLRSEDLFNLIGFQFTIDVEERLLELVGFETGNLPEMSEANYNILNRDKGQITTSWNEPNTVLTMETGIVARLRLRARRSGDLFTALSVLSEPTPSEAYNYNRETLQVLLQFLDKEGQTKPYSVYRVYQNYPNPFDGATQIGFVLPSRVPVSLEVFDRTGRLVHRHEATYPQGYSEYTIPATALPAHGLYYYRVSAEGATITKKMIYASGR